MNLVSRAELARKIGISRQAIAKAIKQDKLRLVGEGRTAKVDLHDIKTVDYIRDNSSNRQVAIESKKKDQDEGEENTNPKNENDDKGEELGETVEIRNRKLRLQTRELEIKMAEKLGELISRKEIESVFSEISSTIVSYFFPLGDRLSTSLAGIFETTDQDKINTAKTTIDKEVGRALEAMKNEIAENLTDL